MNIEVEKLPTTIWGLAYTPKVAPEIADKDHLFGPEGMPFIPTGGFFSAANAGAMKAVLALLRPRSIMEIGVWCGRTREHSSTDCILRNKPSDAWYFGVDIADEGRAAHIAEFNDPKAVFVRSDSSDIGTVCDQLLERSIPRPDLIWIDGRHSVSQCLKDWRYAGWVTNAGVILLHDINYHPGPRVLFDAVDERFFEKIDLFPPLDPKADPAFGADYGMGLLVRR